MIHFTVPLSIYDWQKYPDLVLLSIYNDFKERRKPIDSKNLREYLVLNHPRISELSDEIWRTFNELENTKRKLNESI